MKNYNDKEIMEISQKLAEKYPFKQNDQPEDVRSSAMAMGVMLATKKATGVENIIEHTASFATGFYMGSLLARYTDIRMFMEEEVTQ